MEQALMRYKKKLSGEDTQKIGGELDAKETWKTKAMIRSFELDPNVMVAELQ